MIKVFNLYKSYGGVSPVLSDISFDVQDGEFQIIEGSHTWSGDNDHNEYTNDTIEEKYKDKIISFKKNAGGIIISNIYGIHRAKPTKDKSFVRKSLFLQIDDNLNIALPIYIKT